MERLLADAQKLTGVKYDISNLSDVYEAIHAVQIELGITGTTAKESAETLLGSFSSLKASWENFLSGSGDLNVLMEPLQNTVNNLVRIMGEAIPFIFNSIVASLPEFLKLGMDLIENLKQGIFSNLSGFLDLALQIIEDFLKYLVSCLPEVLQTGIQVLTELIKGIALMLPELIPMAIECILTLVETLLDNIDLLIDAGINLIIALAEGIIYALPILIEKTPEIIEKLYTGLLRNFPKIIQAGYELIGKLVLGILGSELKLIEVGPKLIRTLINGITGIWDEMKKVGIYAVEGLWNGISGMAGWLKNKVKEFASGIVKNMKSALGIHSPSKVFADEIGQYLGLGLGEGFEDSLDSVYKKMKKSVDYENAKLSANLTNTHQIKLEKEDRQIGILEGIDENKEIILNTNTYLDGKVVANTVNKVNSKMRLQYGY